jgi:signal transduction histidine kinase
MPSMVETPSDPRWPRLLSFSVHEFRTPLTVVSGYVRMLLTDRAGPLNPQQRNLLELVEKSCGRLSDLLAELSDLARLEAGTAPMNPKPSDLRVILKDAIDQLPPMPDREVAVTLRTGSGSSAVQADAKRLAQAVRAIVGALRRELVMSDELLVRETRDSAGGSPRHRILIGDEQTIEAITANEDHLPAFDEWRGGSGMGLAIARWVLNAHGARIWSPPEERKTGALIVFPAST